MTLRSKFFALTYDRQMARAEKAGLRAVRAGLLSGAAGRVLEIGAGSGYQTAVLARLAAQVYAIERIGELAREAQARIRALGIYNATIKAFDGTLGWNAYAPYDGILVAAGGPRVPDPLVAQLKTGGRLVIPIGETRESQRLVRVIKTENGHKVEEHGPCQFVPLIGQHGWTAGQ